MQQIILKNREIYQIIIILTFRYTVIKKEKIEVEFLF